MLNEVENFRVQFLAACKDRQQETSRLKDALKVAVDISPSIFQEDIPADYFHEKKHLWSLGYFELCFRGCEELFSIARLEHLLCVREELRRIGAAGFKPLKNSLNQMSPEEEDVMDASFQPGENIKSFFGGEEINLRQARIAMRFELYDMSLNSRYLEEVVKWAAAQSLELFEPYLTSAFNKPVSDDSNNWDAKYFDIQTEYLNSNFSKERYLHLIKVRQYLRDNKVEGFALVRKNGEPVESKNQKSEKVVDLYPLPAPSSTGSDARACTPNQIPPQTDESKDSMPAVLRTALMLGGAVAALLVLIFSMSR